MRKIIIILPLVLSIIWGVYPDDTIWVSDSLGDDANAGTQSAPKATIMAGLNALSDGGVVIVDNRSGNIYDETVTQPSSNYYYKRKIDWWYPDSGYIQVRRSSGYALNVNQNTANMDFNHMTFYSPDNYAAYYIYGLTSFHSCSLYTDNINYDGINKIQSSTAKFVNCFIAGGKRPFYYTYSAIYKDCELTSYSGNYIMYYNYGSVFEGCYIHTTGNLLYGSGSYFNFYKNCKISANQIISNYPILFSGNEINSTGGVKSRNYFYSEADLYKSKSFNTPSYSTVILVNATILGDGLPIKASNSVRLIFVNCIFIGGRAITYNSANQPYFARFYNCVFDPAYGVTSDPQNDICDWDTINCLVRDPILDSIDYFPQDSLCQIWGVPEVYVEDMDSLHIVAPLTDINGECLAVNDSQWTLGAKSWTHNNNCQGAYNGDVPEIAGYNHFVLQVENYLSSIHGEGSWEGSGGSSSLTASEIADTLDVRHGTGSWEGATPDEIDSVLSDSHGAGSWEGATVMEIDSQLSATHGEGSWEGATVVEIDSQLSSTHGAGSWSGATITEIDSQLSANHGEGSWETASIEPLIVQLSSDELIATLNGQNNRSIEVYKGDYLTIDITVLDANKNPVDLTDATAIFTARTRENSSAYVIQKELTITNPTEGEMRLELTSAETNQTPMSYPADIELILSDGTVKTIWKSTLKIKWDVTR